MFEFQLITLYLIKPYCDYENIQVLHLMLGNLAKTGDETMRRGSQLLFLDLLQR